MKELTPRKLPFGYGGETVTGVDSTFNSYLRRRGANFSTVQSEIRGGNEYVYGFRVGGRLIVTISSNYIYKIK